MSLICNATRPEELRTKIVNEILLRACQERMVSTIGRTTKLSRASHEHAAVALENLAADLKAERV
jgi:hypothetical protein